MQFQFDSFSEFWVMAGHGPYVWACYGITVVCLMWLAISPLRRRKALLTEVLRQQRIAQAEQVNVQAGGQS